MVNTGSKRSRRFVRGCNTSSGDSINVSRGVLRADRQSINSINNWNNNAQGLLADAQGYSTNRQAAGSARLLDGNKSVLNQSTGRRLGPPADWNRSDTYLFIFLVSKFENLTFFFVGGGGGKVTLRWLFLFLLLSFSLFVFVLFCLFVFFLWGGFIQRRGL